MPMGEAATRLWSDGATPRSGRVRRLLRCLLPPCDPAPARSDGAGRSAHRIRQAAPDGGVERRARSRPLRGGSRTGVGFRGHDRAAAGSRAGPLPLPWRATGARPAGRRRPPGAVGRRRRAGRDGRHRGRVRCGVRRGPGARPPARGARPRRPRGVPPHARPPSCATARSHRCSQSWCCSPSTPPSTAPTTPRCTPAAPRRAGADEAALVEAGLTAVAFGGVAAWLAASEAIVATRPEGAT